MTNHNTITADWRNDYVLSSDFVTPGARATLFHGARKGHFVRVARGVYLPADVWSALSYDGRYLAKVRAAALIYGDRLLFSHLSAAALWELPMVGLWPAHPHVLADRARGGRSDAALVRHCDGIPDRTELIEGLQVTTLARTVVDVARTSLFGTAVAMADHVLRDLRPGDDGFAAARTTKPEMRDALDEIHSRSGSALCRRVIEFADGASGSPGESVSRVAIQMLGLSAPVLQQEFRDAEGRIGFVDFFWPDAGVIGEFDGQGKYLRDEYLNGRTTAEVVMDEKRRENRLRALGFTVVRWEWAEAQSLPLLRAKLVTAGVR